MLRQQTTSQQLITYQVELLNRAGYRGNFRNVLESNLPGNFVTEERAGHVLVRNGLQSRNNGAVASIAYNSAQDSIVCRFFA